MKTRHVVAIGILTAIAVGLLAIGIKTHQKSKPEQTSAYYEINTYNYNNNNPTWTINGQPTTYNTSFYQQGGTPITTIIDYSLQYQRNILNLQINFKGFYYIDTNEDLYTVHQYNFPSSITINTPYFNTNQDDLETIYIYLNSITFHVLTEDTTIQVSWEVRNGQTLLSRPTTNVITIKNQRLFLDDINEMSLIEAIDVQNILTKLKNQYQTGYSTGYQTKDDLSDGNFLSIQETMLNVLTMPFTFISQGFNVTLWEGTPYQINIGNFIKSLIAIATILFIIKMFTSGFSVIGNYTTGTGANISQWRKNRSERKLNESKARLNDRTDPNQKSRSTKSDITIHKE